MYKTERQRELMNILKEEKNGGFVSIHRLARQMFASEATIRRDLRELEAQNAIKRAYGGVALMEYLNQNIPLPLREQTHHPEKVEAARRAASVVRDGDVLFLDGASTTLEMIPFLAERKDLTVITNSLPAAMELAGAPGIRLFSLGGQLSGDDFATYGVTAAQTLAMFNATKLIIGVGGITPHRGLTDYRMDESTLLRLFTERADCIIGIADHSKFGVTARYNICPASRLDHLITDSGTPEELYRPYREMGVQVHVVEPEGLEE